MLLVCTGENVEKGDSVLTGEELLICPRTTRAATSKAEMADLEQDLALVST